MTSRVQVGFDDADAAAVAEILHEIETTNTVIAAAQAAQMRALARANEVADRQGARSGTRVRDREMAERAIAAELACAMRVSDRTMQRRMSEAQTVAEHFPATLAAWESGRITRGHLNVIVETGSILPTECRHDFEEAALPRCEVDTPGRVRAGLQILAQRLHPRSLTERHRDARADRRVFVSPRADGMSDLTATLPTLLADAVYDRLTTQANALRDERAQAAVRMRTTGPGSKADASPTGPSEPAGPLQPTGPSGEDHVTQAAIVASDSRSMDQLRADIFADMLLTAAPDADPTRRDDGPGALGAIRAHVQVVVPAITVLGADEHPADLVGRSPIDADTARRLAGTSCNGWDRVLTHPVTGQVLATDRYQPTADLRRRLRARDAHCRFPGCRIPAIRCEHDHTTDHALGGRTCLCNLAGLCQRHHSMKQFTAWRVRQLGDGVLEWRSPLGRIYTDRPPSPAVHFVPDGDPPPF
jgi:hypothetical protein